MMKNFKPGEKIIGASLMDEERAEVIGTFIRPFGSKGTTALLIQTAGGTRCVIDGKTARAAEPTAASTVRQLADHLEGFPDLGHVGNISFPGSLSVQLYEDEDESAIAIIVAWARTVGATTVSARKHEAQWHMRANGKLVGGVPVEIVAIARDEESAALTEASGNSQENRDMQLHVLAGYQRVAGGVTDEHLAEIEHWSNTPLPDEQDPAVTS